MSKHKFENLTKGPKGINLKGGRTVYVEGGQTLEVDSNEIDDGEVASAQEAGYFKIDGKGGKEQEPTQAAEPKPEPQPEPQPRQAGRGGAQG